MGLIVPPERIVGAVDLPEERRLKLRTADGGKLRCWLIGDWRRGRQHPVAPGVENWKKELAALAGLLLSDVKLSIGRVETLK